MKNHLPFSGTILVITLFSIFIIPAHTWAQTGRIAQKVLQFQQKGSFSSETSLFSVSTVTGQNIEAAITKAVQDYTILERTVATQIVELKPSFLSFTVPIHNGRNSIKVLLYKESISPNGFTLLTNKGKADLSADIVHYKGSIDGDMKSVAAFSFSQNDISGIISNAEGNYVIGKLQNNADKYIVYNDKDLREPNHYDCGTNTTIPLSAGNYLRDITPTTSLTAKCVNWYWETDYDLFVSKGSLANVNTYMQGIFNQVATLYANDGVSITLKTLFVWTTEDPYTGTSTSGYLDQFGVYRTSFDGDLATLLGTKGGGGIAWINGLCNSQAKYKMAYCGISNSYSTVPTYSWTVEVVTHEQGHALGSRHTHDCVWNGNNTKIDGCGDAAGYTSGTCTVPPLPTGGGTIMSYCHLTSAGINFNLGFGPQPTTLIVNNVNAAACLANCTSSCPLPNQPAIITGIEAVCSGSTQTYSTAVVSGVSTYAWTIPSGWTGTSTTNTIIVTAGTAGGNITVAATNSCGNSSVRSLAVTIAAIPTQPGIITGNVSVCAGTAQTYTINAISGATSYTWTLPVGWSGTSTTTSINVTSGTSGGAISVKANNSCGSSSIRTKAVGITSLPPDQPGTITGAISVCAASEQTYNIATVSGASAYNWILPAGWSGTSTGTAITVTAGTAGGNISVAAVNGCGAGTARTLAVAISGVAPAAPGTITVSGGSTTICSGDTRTYTIPAVTGVVYNWSAPTGATITSGQGTNRITLSFSTSFTSPGILSVTGTNSCGTGAAKTLSISRTVIGQPSAIVVTGGIVKVCTGDTRTYSVTAVAGMTYAWVVPTGAVINSGQGSASVSISYNANFIANGTLSVTASNTCGSSIARALTIARNVPGTPTAISGLVTPCAGTTSTYSVPVVAGISSYTWTLPSGAVAQGAANGNSINILWGTSGGTLAVKAENNCGISGSRSLKITMSCKGSLTESPIALKKEALVYPNPAKDIANLRFNSTENMLITLTIADMTGRALITEKHQAVTGENFHSFQLSKLTKGTYMILIESRNAKEVVKLNIQ